VIGVIDRDFREEIPWTDHQRLEEVVWISIRPPDA